MILPDLVNKAIMFHSLCDSLSVQPISENFKYWEIRMVGSKIKGEWCHCHASVELGFSTNYLYLNRFYF